MGEFTVHDERHMHSEAELERHYREYLASLTPEELTEQERNAMADYATEAGRADYNGG